MGLQQDYVALTVCWRSSLRLPETLWLSTPSQDSLWLVCVEVGGSEEGGRKIGWKTGCAFQIVPFPGGLGCGGQAFGGFLGYLWSHGSRHQESEAGAGRARESGPGLGSEDL